MRILIVASLLASVALPATASAEGPFGRHGDRSSAAAPAQSSDDSGQRRGGFGSRDNSPRRAERSEAAPAPRAEPRQDRPFFGRRQAEAQSPQDQPRAEARQDRPFFGRRQAEVQAPQDQPRAEARQDRPFLGRRRPEAQAPQAEAPQAQSGAEARQDWRRGRRSDAPDATGSAPGGMRDRLERNRQARRDGGTAPQTAVPTNRSPVRDRTFRDGRDLSHAVWQHHDWRNDRRYDWRDYRSRNRSIFHFGFYNDPFGYGYNRFQIGWSLWPSYYSSNYWLDDPWQYRLPPAYGPYRWVRYWDDALLVDIYTGQVVDVVYDFFW